MQGLLAEQYFEGTLLLLTVQTLSSVAMHHLQLASCSSQLYLSNVNVNTVQYYVCMHLHTVADLDFLALDSFIPSIISQP